MVSGSVSRVSGTEFRGRKTSRPVKTVSPVGFSSADENLVDCCRRLPSAKHKTLGHQDPRLKTDINGGR